MGDTIKITGTNRSLEIIYKSFLAGGTAGMCAKTTVAPLDRIKILLQAHSVTYKHYGVARGLLQVAKQEGMLALYKGNGAQMVRIFPYAATQFTCYETFTQIMRQLLGANSNVGKLLAGSLAGVSAVLLTYPLDMVRARLAFQVTGQHVYTGIVNTVTTIFRTEGGVKALYRGFTPTVIGMIPYAGLSFFCFEKIKTICLTSFPEYTSKSRSENTGGIMLTIPAKLLCGGLSGAIAQSVAYPLDVTRRRMQLSMMDPTTEKFGKSCFTTLGLIYKENGIAHGLYRGMSINYLRAVPMVSMSFCTYEMMKQWLLLDTGLRD